MPDVHVVDRQAQKSRSLLRRLGPFAVLLYTGDCWRDARSSRPVAVAEEREEAKQVDRRHDHGPAIVSGSSDQPRRGEWKDNHAKE